MMHAPRFAVCVRKGGFGCEGAGGRGIRDCRRSGDGFFGGRQGVMSTHWMIS